MEGHDLSTRLARAYNRLAFGAPAVIVALMLADILVSDTSAPVIALVALFGYVFVVRPARSLATMKHITASPAGLVVGGDRVRWSGVEEVRFVTSTRIPIVRVRYGGRSVWSPWSPPRARAVEAVERWWSGSVGGVDREEVEFWDGAWWSGERLRPARNSAG